MEDIQAIDEDMMQFIVSRVVVGKVSAVILVLTRFDTTPHDRDLRRKYDIIGKAPTEAYGIGENFLLNENTPVYKYMNASSDSYTINGSIYETSNNNTLLKNLEEEDSEPESEYRASIGI